MSDKPTLPSVKDTKKKQTMVIAGVGMAFLAIIWGGLTLQDSKTGQTTVAKPAEPESYKRFTTPSTQVRDEDKWMAEGGNQVQKLTQGQDDLRREMEAFKAEKARVEQERLAAAAGGKEGGSSPASSFLQSALPNVPPPPMPIAPPAPGTPISGGTMPLTPDGKPMPSNDFQQVDLTDDQAKGKVYSTDPSKDKEKSIVKNINTFVPAGAFAKAVLLGGVDAPTGGQAANMALPVVMRVKSFFHLPNYYQQNLKECFITGNAYGDLPSERAYIRTDKMSCVLRNGSVIEVAVKGHLNGEDGSFGMRGRVVSKQGQMLAKAFFSGMFAGIGSSIAQQNQIVQSSALGTVTTVDPNKAAQSGVATGASTALNKVADFYMQQANQIFPIIEIAAGRVGEIYLMDGADFGAALINANATAAATDSGDKL